MSTIRQHVTNPTVNAAANAAEPILRKQNEQQNNTSGYSESPAITTDVSNPSNNKELAADPSGEKMHALTWNGSNSVKLIETNKPKVIDPRDVVIKVTGSTICGSDLHLYHGSIPQLQNGDILGHEFCGVVDSVGSAVTGLVSGERVVASFQIACGTCSYCKEGLSSMCDRTGSSEVQNMLLGPRIAGCFGYSHLTGGFAGGQAEYVRVPFGDVNLLKLPDDVPDEKGLYLSDVLPTSYHCVHDTGVYKGNTVAIWGLGPIGLFCAIWAFKAGASRVIGIDNNWRLDYAKSRVPNLELLNFSEVKSGKGVAGTLLEMVPGGVDVALECVAGEYPKGWLHKAELALGLETDTSEILNEMVISVRKFGRVGITGVYAGFTNHFNIGAVMQRGIRLIGNGQAPVHKYWKEILVMIQTGEIDPTVMLTHRLSLEDAPAIYAKFNNREEGIVKPFIQTKFSHPPAVGTPPLTRF
jgi:threonine dehydrogenase-like Zn-dependent dehydrogenase